MVDHKTYSFESWLKIVEERFQVNSLTARDNNANDMIDAFDFTQSPRAPVVLAATLAGSPYPPTLQTLTRPQNALLTVNNAFGTYSVAPGAVASAFGAGLANSAVQAQSLPLGTSLGGVTVSIADTAGTTANAQLYYVSPSQVNFVVPATIGSGVATVTVTNNGNKVASGNASIASVAPAIYTADASGSGFAAAIAASAASSSLIAQCGASGCTPNPIDLSQGAVYLALYGTGIRNSPTVTVTIGNENVTPIYAGPQNQYPGLDQINVQIPADLKGRGRLSVVVTVNGQISNPVWITLA